MLARCLFAVLATEFGIAGNFFFSFFLLCMIMSKLVSSLFILEFLSCFILLLLATLLLFLHTSPKRQNSCNPLSSGYLIRFYLLVQ